MRIEIGMDENGYINNHHEKLKSFYAPYFTKESDLDNFLSDAFEYENGSLPKRQMLYQVHRFVSLANDIDKLRPGRDCLRMLFIKICLELLCSLSGYTDKQKRQFYTKFIGCFSEQGKQYILSNFTLSDFDDMYCGHVYETHHDLTCICQGKVDTKKHHSFRSPVRSCTELGFYSPRRPPVACY